MNTISQKLPIILRKLSFVIVTFVTIVAVMATDISAPASAAPCGSGCVASMSTSPASGTYNPGSTITVTIYVNSGGQSINAAQANLTYTSSRLQFQSIDASGSAFGIDAPSSGGGGSVSIARGNISAVSGGSLLVARVSFQVLSGTGTASIALSGSSEVNKSDGTGDNILGSSTGSSYTIVEPTPPPTTPSPPSPTPQSQTTKPSNNSSQTPSNNTTPTPSTPSTTTPATETPQTPVTEEEEPALVATQQTEKKKNNPLTLIALAIGGVLVVAGGAATVWWYLRRQHAMPVKSGDIPSDAFITGGTLPSTAPPKPVSPSEPTLPSGPVTPISSHSDTLPPNPPISTNHPS